MAKIKIPAKKAGTVKTTQQILASNRNTPIATHNGSYIKMVYEGRLYSAQAIKPNLKHAPKKEGAKNG